nr:MAG TPA: Protein of unknown function (DUF423) [Caudoviricetes sp.]DAX23103.1 MAG TPA: Protein of unknown function (DUF423) [Caudoviricetes sp.]
MRSPLIVKRSCGFFRVGAFLFCPSLYLRCPSFFADAVH